MGPTAALPRAKGSCESPALPLPSNVAVLVEEAAVGMSGSGNDQSKGSGLGNM